MLLGIAMWRELCARERRGVAQPIAEEHGLPLDVVEALLAEVVALRAWTSGLCLDPETWRVPSDLPSWRETSRQLAALARGVKEADAALDWVLANPVAAAVLGELIAAERVADFAGLLAELRLAMDALHEIRGPGHGGRRPNPDWHATAVERCAATWRVAGREPTVGLSRRGDHDHEARRPGDCPRAIEPRSAFARFAFDVLRAADAEITDEECSTALGR